MWLFTQYGFYSIVQKKPSEYHVRARVRGDLTNLVKLTKVEATISESKMTDYRYRIIVDKKAVSSIMQVLADNIDYSNFKSRIHETPDQLNKGSAYMDVWSAMASVQRNS